MFLFDYLLTVKSRYFKIDDVSYPLRILHRYMSDTFRYVSEEYPKINFFFYFKNNYSILPNTY